MLISDVIANAKSRFSTLLTGEKEIQAYLAQALTAYQDMAGCVRTIRHAEPEVTTGHAMPDHFLAHAGTVDARGNFVIVSIDENDDGQAALWLESSAVYPITTEYFVHLAYYADKPDKHIPNRIAGLIIDYLECLIAMDNDDRISRAEAASKMDASRLPTRLDRQAQKDALEEKIKASRAIVSLFSIHPH